MFADLSTRAGGYHDEYARRHVNPPEPQEQPRQGLRHAIGNRLIHLGEKLAMPDPTEPFDRAA
jgi:hypothetical protein